MTQRVKEKRNQENSYQPGYFKSSLINAGTDGRCSHSAVIIIFLMTNVSSTEDKSKVKSQKSKWQIKMQKIFISLSF